MEALVRVNGGHWSGSMGVLKRVNGRWSGSMGVLNNGGSMGGIEKDQWGLALGQAGVWLVRQGCGCGSDRRLSYRVVSSTLQGCKLYLARL